MGRTIAWATLVAGTFDILSAFLWSALAGGGLGGILPFVASGPFGDGVPPGVAGQLLGLLVHFAFMAAMAAAYVLLARRIPLLNQEWLVCGLVYGVVLWIVMYWIVMPLRWDSYRMPSEAWPIVQQLISHCLLTGLPIAWIASRSRRRR